MSNILLLLLDAFSWWPGISGLWIIITVLIVVVVSLIGILSTGRKEAQDTDKRRADASSELIKVLDRKILELEKENEDLKTAKAEVDEELEDTTTELRTLQGIKMSELITFFERLSNKQQTELAKIHESASPHSKRLKGVE